MAELSRRLAPWAFGLLLLIVWEWVVRAYDIKPYLLPSPSAIVGAFVRDAEGLGQSLIFTLRVTLEAFALAAILGLILAIGFTRSAILRAVLYPYAIILQVTPVVSIAPLIIIWVGIDNIEAALLILATIVAFFPILSNAVLGFSSVDPNLRDLMRLYGAGPFRIFIDLELPSALPQILAGLKIAGGLALIGAVVAEFVAGSGGATGLAWRIIEAGNRLQIPSMFAALVLLSFLGIAIFSVLGLIEWLLLRHWHDSAIKRD
jgi:NitT/TauT family transport system permease protein